MACDQALRIDPKSIEAWNNKGYALSKLKDDAAALANFEVAVALDPNDALSWANKGNTLNELIRIP